MFVTNPPPFPSINRYTKQRLLSLLHLAQKVHQGYFDILFPTDFALTESLYRALTGKLTRVMAHGEFVKRWCEMGDIQTKSGESPLVNWYQNASFMSSV